MAPLLCPAAAGAQAVRPVEVVANGVVPGFDNRQQLTAFLIDTMRQVVGARWQLRPATEPDVVVFRSAVIWEFRGLAYASGSVRYVGPGDRSVLRSVFGGHRPYSIEARLYIDGAYQVTLLRQPSIRGGARDRSLQDVITAMTRELAAAGETN